MLFKQDLVLLHYLKLASLVDQTAKNLPTSAGDPGLILGCGRIPLEKGMATHSSILAWREKPGRLQSMGSKRVGHA